MVPRYGCYEDAWDTDVRQKFRIFDQDHEVGYFHCYIDNVDFVFIDHPCYLGKDGSEIYGGSAMDGAFRNALLCKAALEAVWHVPCGGITYGDENLCFIANDWHTALLPVYLQVRAPSIVQTMPCLNWAVSPISATQRFWPSTRLLLPAQHSAGSTAPVQG